MKENLIDELNRLHAQVCGALSDANRILILYFLAEGSKSVTGLVNDLGISQSTVSRHLKILRERNMVISHREGQSVIYELGDERIIQALDLLRAFMADEIEAQIELVKAAQKDSGM